MPSLCAFGNCRKNAYYNFKGERKRLFCKEHKEDGMMSVNTGYICQKEDCLTVATYNLPSPMGRGLSPAYCKKHALPHMTDVKNRKCDVDGCNIQLYYNLPGLNPSHCKKHALPAMIDVRSKICKSEGCNTHASYNLPGLKAIYCKEHALKHMTDVKNRKCNAQGCNIQPYFNLPGLKAIYCKEHALPDMVDVRNKKCQSDGCNTIATFNLAGLNPRYCKKHSQEGMVNLRSRMCPNCKDWIDPQAGNPKYRFYCSRCFQRLFPLDPLTFQIQYRSKEIAVRDFINTIFDGFQHDKTLFLDGCDCTHRRRVDLRKLIANTMLCIEIDEGQHKKYSAKDEELRYDDLFMVFSGKWIFIRFNPDKYVNKNGARKNPTIATRLYTLKCEIQKQIDRIENEEKQEPLEMVKLYFDGY